MTYKEGITLTGNGEPETIIHIVDDNGEIVYSLVVLHWPSDEAEKAVRGQRLVDNYIASLTKES